MSAGEPSKRVFMPMGDSSDFLKKPEKNAGTGSSKSKTLRLDLDLFEPDERTFPEFNYKKLVHIEKVIWTSIFFFFFARKKKKREKEKNPFFPIYIVCVAVCFCFCSSCIFHSRSSPPSRYFWRRFSRREEREMVQNGYFLFSRSAFCAKKQFFIHDVFLCFFVFCLEETKENCKVAERKSRRSFWRCW